MIIPWSIISIQRFIFNVINIILNWPTPLQADNQTIKDGCRVIIYFEDTQTQKLFVFKNKLPEDFYKLEVLLDEVIYNVGKNL